jgi:rSAM/selenodomain-associated transferase 1
MSTLIVVAKAPVPGRVKTRLCPPFTPGQAAALAAAALRDTLAIAASTSADHRLLVLDGSLDPELRRACLRHGFTRRPQVPGSLDVRLAAAFGEAARLDPGPAVLIGMDTPQASAFVLDTALKALEAGYDAAFAPAADGGFWALGLREPAHPHTAALLLGVPMSSPDTGAVQLRRLQDAGLDVVHLPVLRDVDTADCAYAAAELRPDTAFAKQLAAIDAHA